MRKLLSAVGVTATVGAMMLGLSATAANAAPPAATGTTAAKAAAVYMGTYTWAGCFNWISWWNSQGYVAYCVIRGSVADLYVQA